MSKYKLSELKALEQLVADAVEVHIPFNNPITGFCAFVCYRIGLPVSLCMAMLTSQTAQTHKAGIHAKAILANPTTYEIINPADFGMSRYVHFASRLTGWNAIKSRCEQLGLAMTDEQVKQCTVQIKAMADIRKLAIEDTDVIINNFFKNLNAKTDKPLLSGMTAEEKTQFAEKERELREEEEARNLQATGSYDPGFLNSSS